MSEYLFQLIDMIKLYLDY